MLLRLLDDRVVRLSAGAHPNLPVTYCSVRSSSGLEKILAVGLNSTSAAGAAIAVGIDLGGEERGAVAHPGGLLHVVGDDDDRVVELDLLHQLLDPGGRDRVERRARLVHQDHLGLDGDAAGDAQPLLLPARQPHRRLLETVLDLVPQRRPLERPFDDRVQFGPLLDPVETGAEGEVVVNRLGERVRLLEDHPDPSPHLNRVDVRAVQVDAVVEHLALDPSAVDQIVHPVEATDDGRLAAP